MITASGPLVTSNWIIFFEVKNNKVKASTTNITIWYTLIFFYKNTLIEIEPQLFLTKTANWVSIVLKVFLVYMYDVIIVQPMKILSSIAAIN